MLVAFFSLSAVAPANAPTSTVRLYAIECGRIDFESLARFSDTDEIPDRPGWRMASCYLVRHDAEWLIWDTGVGDTVAGMRDGERLPGGVRFTLRRTLAASLGILGLRSADIRYVGLSHMHADHSGNIGLFPQATILISKQEMDFALGRPTPSGLSPASVAALSAAKLESFEGDKDVFGDGTVRILKASGHTPGHRILMVTLPHSGKIILAGDLYAFRESIERRLVPVGNASRSETMASFDRVARLARGSTRIVVQHDPSDFATLPSFPSYLD